MNIAIHLSSFDINNVFYLEKTKNVIIDGEFSKIIYSTPDFVMNGITIDCKKIDRINMHNINNDRYLLGGLQSVSLNRSNSRELLSATHTPSVTPQKTLFIFNPQLFNNIEFITCLSEIEDQIINQYKQMKSIHKLSVYNLKTQLLHGYIKTQLLNDVNDLSIANLSLKISGIWETSNTIGITFKFTTST